MLKIEFLIFLWIIHFINFEINLCDIIFCDKKNNDMTAVSFHTFFLSRKIQVFDYEKSNKAYFFNLVKAKEIFKASYILIMHVVGFM